MRRLTMAFLAIFAGVLTQGCAQLVGPGQGIVVTVSNAQGAVPPFSAIQVGTKPVTLTATVTNDPGHGGVRWSLSLGNLGCSPDCGMLAVSPSPSLSAVYTPPATAPQNQTATITAIAVDDSRKLFGFDFTIIPAVSVSILPPKFTTQVAGALSAPPLMAAVQNDSAKAGVTWSLTAGGASCAPTACGTLTATAAPSFSATYQPPATVPTGANASPTITATSVTDPSKSDSFNFTIVSPTTLLNKHYAILLRGYDLNGSPMAMAGSVAADGNGNITGGEMDFNNGGGLTNAPSPLTGNYSIDLSFNGIPHGTITITSFHFPGTTNPIVLKFVLSSDGSRGTILELDGIGFINVGTIVRQDDTAISAAVPAGPYVFELDSDAPFGARTVAAGQFVLGSGGITSGLIDEARAGDPLPRYFGVPLAAAPAAGTDAAGRGTMTFVVNGTATVTASSTQYAYYLVNAGQLNLIEVDAGATFGTVQAGVARTQKPLTSSSLNTTSVFQWTGMDVTPGTITIGPEVMIGVMKISGATTAGTATFQVTFDSNDLGNILISHATSGAVASFDPATGRGVISLSGGFATGFVDLAVFYLSDTGQGVMIDADPSTCVPVTVCVTPPPNPTTNNALSGTFTPQSGPFNAQSVSGNVLFESGGTASPNIPNVAAAFHFDNTAFAYSAFGDLTSLSNQLANFPNASFSGSYSIFDAKLGHGSVMLPQQFFGAFGASQYYPAAFYLIGPNQFVSIGAQSGAYSGVAFFTPQ